MQHRYIILHVDGETADWETTGQWIAITIGGDQQRGEVDARPRQGFAVITIVQRMIQWAKQGEGIAAVAAHLQAKDVVTADARGQGISRNAIAERLAS
ncbi:hypothetical protein D9M68_895620 [compost metagenome]